MTLLESQVFSVIVFAGAAQLVAIDMIKNGASIVSILLTILLLILRHLFVCDASAST